AANQKRVFLTFDDGFAHLVDTALPILSRRGVPFHVFLVTDFAGRENTWDLSLGRPPFRHLDDAQVNELAAAGVTFGSHTASHRDLTRMTPEEVRDDFARSRRAVTNATGRPARTLSYPFGRYDDAVRAAAAAAGFEAAFSLYPSHRNDVVDRFALRRDAVYIIDPARAIEIKLSPNPLYGVEEMKCRAINAAARLTPLFKRARR
ncbi:MAG TPA: polysaccharide deacetylase family protein, partial [Candidatus Krumholzibacteria bacterium]|nr:polysaccharide deacetylase family protein [Candidatus Krumholzibacteria bacterium]